MDKVRSALEIEKKKENHQNEKQKKTHFHRKNSGNESTSAPVDLELYSQPPIYQMRSHIVSLRDFYIHGIVADIM